MRATSWLWRTRICSISARHPSMRRNICSKMPATPPSARRSCSSAGMLMSCCSCSFIVVLSGTAVEGLCGGRGHGVPLAVGQAVREGPAGGFCPVGDVELPVDVGEMELDGLLGDPQLLADRLVGESAGDRFENRG